MTDPQAAMTIEACAAEWLERKDRGEWSEADSAEFEAWCAQDPAHAVAVWRLDSAWAFADRLAALKRPRFHETMLARTRSLWPLLPKLAAGALVAAVVGAAAIYFSPEARETRFATDIGERKTLQLRDGSSIEMNTGTVLRMANDGTQRKVWLEKGEALFNIRHDAARPFVVLTSGHRITDLGTKFVVREAPDSLEVTLLEGRARLESGEAALKPQLAFLAPGDVVVATATTLDITRKTPRALVAALGWQRGVLVFQRTTLAEAVAEFNRYNTKRLVIGDAQTAHLEINGTFRNDDAQSFANTARAVFGLRVEKRGDEIVLTQ